MVLKMVVDRSFLRPVLLKVYIGPLFRLVPSTLSPNFITIVGLAASLSMLGFVRLSDGRTAGLAALCAVLINVYILADHFDGMQAKKYDRASRFGEFLDHFCDFFSGACIIVAAYSFTDMSSTWLVIVSVSYVFAFIASHFEHNASGELRFPLVGPLEALVIASGFFLVAFLHQDYWITNRFMGVQYQYLFAATFLFGFLWCTWTTISRMKPALRPCHFEFAAGVVLLGICSLLLQDAWRQLLLVMVLFSAANTASVLAGERLLTPKLACRELPLLAGVCTAVFCGLGLAGPAYAPWCNALLGYAALRSALYMYQTIFHLRRYAKP
jgi:phosphatidylglycerophosphate synthase